MSFRGQLQGFFFGFAIAGGIAMYQLQKDMWSSHRMIMASVHQRLDKLDADVAAFKEAGAEKSSQATATPASAAPI